MNLKTKGIEKSDEQYYLVNIIGSEIWKGSELMIVGEKGSVGAGRD